MAIPKTTLGIIKIPESTLGTRIRTARGEASQDAFAKILHISKGALGFYERDENLPNSDVILKICSLAGVSVEWLLMGSGPMEAGQPAPPSEDALGSSIDRQGDRRSLTMVPLVAAVLSAGGGSFETNAKPLDYFAFHTRWLKRKGQISSMALMRVSGDSMQPIINNKDLVLVDKSQTEPRAGMVYAVSVEDMIYLKKINAVPGKIILTSFNKEYPPVEVPTGEQMQDMVRILGRAVWWCHEA